jgi:hypothetical protein
MSWTCFILTCISFEEGKICPFDNIILFYVSKLLLTGAKTRLALSALRNFQVGIGESSMEVFVRRQHMLSKIPSAFPSESIRQV